MSESKETIYYFWSTNKFLNIKMVLFIVYFTETL